jgi:hypothetical protein
MSARCWSVCLLAGLFLSTVASAEDLAQGPTSRAKSNNACAKLGAAYVTGQERLRAAEMGQWIADCNLHPQRSVCDETAELIQGTGKTSPLHCVGVMDAGPDRCMECETPSKNPDLSPISRANNACAKVGAAIVSNGERQFATEMGQWIADCNHHPTRSTCEDTVELIQAIGKKSPLNCAGG